VLKVREGRRVVDVNVHALLVACGVNADGDREIHPQPASYFR
jgi:transposase-like protein